MRRSVPSPYSDWDDYYTELLNIYRITVESVAADITVSKDVKEMILSIFVGSLVPL